MRSVLIFLLLVMVGLTPYGCSKKVMYSKSYGNKTYVSGGISTDEIRERKYKTELNAEVGGYPDNPLSVFEKAPTPAQEPEPEQESSLSFKKLQQSEQPAGQQVWQQMLPQQILRSKPKRMITYDGFITSRSTKPDSLIAHAVTLAESLKGYVEMQNTTSVTLRVPVAVFGVVYDSLLKLGEVIDYQKSSEDITDAFRDTDLRVTILEKTMERYVKLIRLVKDEKEKILLLKEIEKLREELEVLRVQKSVLALRAAFAKVQFTVQQITTGFAGVTRTNVRGFDWIGYLDPINSFRFGRKMKLPVPEGMVLVDRRDYWIAQSPAGSRVWTALVRNDPEGTADFWCDAVTCKLSEEFLHVDTSTAGGYRFVRCTPQPGVHYRYGVGIKVVGKSLQIIQCFFPDELQEKRYFDSIVKTLTAGGAS